MSVKPGSIKPGGGWPEGVERLLLDSVDSTSAEAMRRAPQIGAPLWILAREQTAGRGRRARAWSSPRGNFSATLLMQPEGDLAQVALRSFVAALAVHDALVALTGLPECLALKWPNDVLFNGGKLAGILLEGSSGAGHPVLCIGIGVNLIAAPEATQMEPGAVPAVSLLGETGLRFTPEHLLDALAPAFAEWEARLLFEGFEPLRAAWLSQAARRDELIIARTGVGPTAVSRQGIFRGVDSDGALLLEIERDILAIPAADVFF